MTVTAAEQRNQYLAVAGQTTFTYTFEIVNATDLNVYKVPSGANPNDTTYKLIYTTDYTVTGVGSSGGGTIVLTTGATLNDLITIEGNVPVARSTSFTPGGVIRAEDLNTEFDNQTLIAQKIQTQIDENIPKYYQSAQTASADLTLPALPAGTTWRKNDLNTAIETVTIPSGGIPSNQDTYVTMTAAADLPNGYPLSAVGAGMMVNAPGTTSILARTITGVTDQTSVTNGTGLAGNPTIGLASNPVIPGTAGMGIPQGTTAQRVIPTSGIGLRFNTDTSEIEAYIGGQWVDIPNQGDVDALIARLAAHTASNGASMIGLLDQGAVSGKFVQDLANATIIAQTDNGTLANGVFLSSLATGIYKITNGTGALTLSAPLTSIDGLSTAANQMLYTTGSNTYAVTSLSAYIRTLLDDPDAATAASTLQVLPLAGGTMTGGINMGGFEVTNAAAPTASSSLATKGYVDNLVTNIQQACDYATTADLTGWVYNNGAGGIGATLTAPSAGTFQIDGVTPTAGQRILVKDMATPAYNGVYDVTTNLLAANGVLTRSSDYDEASEMQAGDIFAVVGGSTQSATQWMMTQNAAITVGTTAITFGQLSNTGALLKANNLSDLANVSTAVSNLSLTIGVNTQAYNANLQSISSLGTAANKMIYTTGINTWAETPITAYGLSLMDDANAAAAQSTLGLVIGTNVQAYNVNLNTVSTPANNAVLVSDNTGVAHWTASLTDGQLLIGSTGSQPVPATLTAGTNITITNAGGSITIASTAGGTTSYSDLFLLMGG